MLTNAKILFYFSTKQPFLTRSHTKRKSRKLLTHSSNLFQSIRANHYNRPRRVRSFLLTVFQSFLIQLPIHFRSPINMSHPLAQGFRQSPEFNHQITLMLVFGIPELTI